MLKPFRGIANTGCTLVSALASLALISVAAMLAIGLSPAPAFAQNCLQDEYTAAGGGKLQCTANDVSVAAVDPTSINIFSGGVGDKCLAGQSFSFTANFEILTTSKSSRSNIGIYFGTGQSNALSGTCTNNIIAPQHSCAGGSAMCGSVQYDELDPSPDNCGDTSSTDTSPQFGAGTEADVFEVDNVTCPVTGTSLSLPVCTSWQVPGKTILCQSPAPSYPWEPAAIPGSPSKCSCGFVSIPVQPVQPAATVAKSCNTAGTSGTGQTFCDAAAEGGTVTYHVTITNTTPSAEGGIVVDQICDSAYGNVFTVSGFAGTACPTGTVGTVITTTCGATDIPNGGSTTCDFTASQGENASVTDSVTVQGHSDLSASAKFGPDTSNTVTVISGDAPTTAKTNKGLAPGPHFACVTLTYTATATNTSSADESLTLNPANGQPALNDSFFGDITTTHGSASVAGSVTGTTCGVATSSSGQGTLANLSGAGAFPQTLAAGTGTPPTSNGGFYTCKFDGVICGTPGPIVTTPGVCTSGTCSAGNVGASCSTNSDCNVTCAEGLQNLDTVTANLTGDDPEDTITQTENQFTANVCLVQSGH